MNSNQPVSLDALVVEPNSVSRINLKEATNPLYEFKSLELLLTIDEAIRATQTNKIYDVMFLSENLDMESVANFIIDAKDTAGGQDAAYIWLLGSNEDLSTKLANSMLYGFDGCLAAPYSVDSLKELILLAAKIRDSRRDKREGAAIKFLLEDIMKNLDRVAYIKNCQMNPGSSLKYLRDACSAFDNFNDHTLDLYYDAAITTFEQANSDSLESSIGYSGSSKRIKDRLVKKMLAEVQEFA